MFSLGYCDLDSAHTAENLMLLAKNSWSEIYASRKVSFMKFVFFNNSLIKTSKVMCKLKVLIVFK